MSLGDLWRLALETPLLNLMVGLTVVCGGSFGLAILVFTVITRGVTFPLTLRSLRSAQRLRELQPKLRDLKRSHRDPAARARAQADLMSRHGVHPLGALGPHLVQLPIFLAMNRVVRLAVGGGSGSRLSERLYDLPALRHALPLNAHFLVLDLGRRGNIGLAGLVLALMVAQGQLSVGDSASGSSGPVWLVRLLMPALFAWFVYRSPAGLGLYWAASVLIGFVLQEAFLHRGRRLGRLPALGTVLLRLSPAPGGAPPVPTEQAPPGPPPQPGSHAPRNRGRHRRRR